MADVISLIPTAVYVASMTTRLMPADQAIDVSAYKSIDFQIDVPGNAPSSVTIQSSMTRNTDDASWVDIGTLSSFNSGNANNYLQVPASTKPLFRFVRWKVDAGVNSATVAVTGMARTT